MWTLTSRSAGGLVDYRKYEVDYLTHISRCATGCGHDITAPLHLGKTKVADHDLGFILGVEIQQVLWLQ